MSKLNNITPSNFGLYIEPDTLSGNKNGSWLYCVSDWYLGYNWHYKCDWIFSDGSEQGGGDGSGATWDSFDGSGSGKGWFNSDQGEGGNYYDDDDDDDDDDDYDDYYP